MEQDDGLLSLRTLLDRRNSERLHDNPGSLIATRVRCLRSLSLTPPHPDGGGTLEWAVGVLARGEAPGIAGDRRAANEGAAVRISTIFRPSVGCVLYLRGPLEERGPGKRKQPGTRTNCLPRFRQHGHMPLLYRRPRGSRHDADAADPGMGSCQLLFLANSGLPDSMSAARTTNESPSILKGTGTGVQSLSTGRAAPSSRSGIGSPQ